MSLLDLASSLSSKSFRGVKSTSNTTLVVNDPIGKNRDEIGAKSRNFCGYLELIRASIRAAMLVWKAVILSGLRELFCILVTISSYELRF